MRVSKFCSHRLMKKVVYIYEVKVFALNSVQLFYLSIRIFYNFLFFNFTVNTFQRFFVMMNNSHIIMSVEVPIGILRTRELRTCIIIVYVHRNYIYITV